MKITKLAQKDVFNNSQGRLQHFGKHCFRKSEGYLPPTPPPPPPQKKTPTMPPENIELILNCSSMFYLLISFGTAYFNSNNCPRSIKYCPRSFVCAQKTIIVIISNSIGPQAVVTI